MTGSEEDSITDLLKDYMSHEADLRHIVEKVLEDGLNVRKLISMSDSEIDDLIHRYFPLKLLVGVELGFKVAIQKRKALTHEEEPPSKMRNLALDVTPSMVTEMEAEQRYYEKLLEPPAELPRSVDQLKAFLSLRPAKLPIKCLGLYLQIHEPELVMFDTTATAQSLAGFCEILLKLMQYPCPDNEATSSSDLCLLTGYFLRFLNEEAPADNKLKCLRFRLDSADCTTTSATWQPLLRPDFQLFVKSCLILRWENERDETLLVAAAAHENISKLKAWSPLVYGKVPYVIGGCCVGRQFQWLKLSPKGDKIVFEYISDQYDLNLLSDVAKFLHSTIRMHCLLQKLQEIIDHSIHLALYSPTKRSGGVVVTVYPDVVTKEIPVLDTARWTVLNSLYESIAGSRYLIQRESFRITSNRIIMQLQPVGDPIATPYNWGDFVNAIHDILNGLADLHGKGYTHRDLRWDNCIKVNDKSNWKWVIIDLEYAGLDNEVWDGEGFFGWDEETLEEDNDKRKRYTKGSDMYQLGNLIAHWLDNFYAGDRKEIQVMRSLEKQLLQERTAAVKVLEDVCKKGCERCRMFGTKL